MINLRQELSQQPQALESLIEYFRSEAGKDLLKRLPTSPPLLLTGMGASFHAAWIGALHLNHLGTAAASMEAIDLIHYAAGMVASGQPLIYISQSGGSGEVGPVLEALQGKAEILAVTNQPQSELARRSQQVLPMSAGNETLIASKTYLNSLAGLWLLGRAWAGRSGSVDLEELHRLAGRIQTIFDRGEANTSRLLEQFDQAKPLLFLGHGPHAATARQAAMMLSEWAKKTALDHGIGAFRHGFIESVAPGTGALIFAPPGKTQASALHLAEDLQGYGARVLLVENGRLKALGEALPQEPVLDEFLSPALDILPIQLFAEALRERANIPPGFCHISKVVTQL